MMDQEQLNEIVANAREVLAQELKAWLDPKDAAHQAKLVQGLFALRNFGGGRMLIGFEDGTGKPLEPPEGFDTKKEYEQDSIQRIVSKHASKQFEVNIGFGKIKDTEYPVLEVPSDIIYPVSVKKGIVSPLNGKDLIQIHDVYVRTLSSNGTPSSSKAHYNDWEGIVERCFANREADIGGFIRRQLGSSQVAEFISALQQWGSDPNISKMLEFGDNALLGGRLANIAPEDEGQRQAKHFLDLCEGRAEELFSTQSGIPDHGVMEISAAVDGQCTNDHHADEEFLRLLDTANPRYTGWPFWVALRGAPNVDDQPYAYTAGYEALMIDLSSWMGMHIDFWRAEPVGRFYHRRALQDDMGSERAPPAGTALDFGLAVIRTAEAMLVPMAYAKAMGYEPQKTSIGFVFRWTGLQGRQLSSWANPQRIISPGRVSRQDEVETNLTIPLEVPPSALAPFVMKAVRPLFAAFEGFVISDSVIEDLTERLVERRL